MNWIPKVKHWIAVIIWCVFWSYLKQFWKNRLNGQECQADDSCYCMRTANPSQNDQKATLDFRRKTVFSILSSLRAVPFKDWFVWGKKSGDTTCGTEGEEEEHAGKELWVEIFGLSLLFLYASCMPELTAFSMEGKMYRQKRYIFAYQWPWEITAALVNTTYRIIW